MLHLTCFTDFKGCKNDIFFDIIAYQLHNVEKLYTSTYCTYHIRSHFIIRLHTRNDLIGKLNINKHTSK